MDKREKKKQELLEELARRFRDSASTLKKVAKRINDASVAQRENCRRLDSAGARLRECVGSKTGPLSFSYLEYVEFSTAEEFHKFRVMPTVTEEEINAVDWEELSRQLLS
jgi:hypothetical protein